MGIRPESSHHEEGPGQNELDFRFDEALPAADHALTFQRVVKTIAHRNGMAADFSPKPLEDLPGCPYWENCPVRLDKCQNTKPELVNHDGVMIRCFNFEGANDGA